MSRLRKLGSKRGAALASVAILAAGGALMIDAMPPSSVGDLKEVLRARAGRLCSAYRISCTIEDSAESERLQVLIGSRDGATARTVITYGDVPWRLIRTELGCPRARTDFDCPTILDGLGAPETAGFDADGFGVDGGGPAVFSYGPTRSPESNRRPAVQEDQVGITPTEALRNDLFEFTEPSVLSYARSRGWDDWDDYFDTRDTRPLEPCPPGYRKSWHLKPDGSSTRPLGLRDCLLVNQR